MTTNALLSRYDALLSDLDGVVYAGPFAIEGAPEALNRAEEELNVPVIFVTNNASRSVESVAEHLRELGVHTRAERVVSSAQAGAALLAQHVPAGSKVLITGTEALADCVRDAGLEPVRTEAEVRSPHPGLQPEDGLGRPRRSRLHPRKPRCAVDRNQHRPDHPQGARSGARQRNPRSSRSNRLTPYPARCGQARSAHLPHCSKVVNSSRPVIVGDRLDTDILGANNAKMDGALVLTGVQTYQDVIE